MTAGSTNAAFDAAKLDEMKAHAKLMLAHAGLMKAQERLTVAQAKAVEAQPR